MREKVRCSLCLCRSLGPIRKCTLSRTISRYMVLIASEQKLLMMRPYQIYAVKAIVFSRWEGLFSISRERLRVVEIG